ncbi:hypothetical protein [Clostridium sp.]|uniref:hypothetical protein n=1 Tax=Clostridium sp. TaxID=1506 RepID=UPI00351FC803
MLKMVIRMNDDKITAENKYGWMAFTTQSIIHSKPWAFPVWRMVPALWYSVTAAERGILVCSAGSSIP